MRKIIVWIKINWIKIFLIVLFTVIIAFLAIYVRHIILSYNSLESFTKKQASGMMAMYMPMFIFSQLVLLPLSFLMYWYLYKGGGIGSMKKNKIGKDSTKVHWDDIIGMTEAKKDAKEVVNLLRDHALQKAVGGNIIKGALMIGPPGCGKTYLAKAMATECDLPMIAASGSEFVAMFMGQGAAKMKSLFKQARAEAKIYGGCLVFIDEIDAFARQRVRGSDRAGGAFGGSDTSYNATINQFLTEFDGLRKKENNIIVIAATNINEEELDEAIMRSGRFDRKIRVEKPNAEERELVLNYYLSKVTADPKIDVKHFADKTKWFSPSDISNVVKEAGVFALRGERDIINTEDMKNAVDRIMVSIEKMGGDKILGDKVAVHWDQVIGMRDAKEEAWEVVKMLKDRKMVQAIGGKIVKGMVMFGPPGCGKTYLAKAIATESGFPFISVAGSEYVTMWVGEGAKKMKETFAEARKLAKAEGGCIIFFDEIDSFARHRGSGRDNGGTSHNATINQFLTEMDGLRKQENTVMVMGATNASEGDLDSAIMRSGRLERKIYVKRPNNSERQEIFKFYLSKVKTDYTIKAEQLARIAVGFTPAEIDNMIREAGLICLRADRETITQSDMTEAYDRITIGALSNSKYSKKEKEMTAYHEAGHAIITYLMHPTDEVIKATIRARKNYLGYVYYRSSDDYEDGCEVLEEVLAGITISLGGYAAEKIIYGTVTTGVYGDFKAIMGRAHHMVWELGMGRSGLLGNFLMKKGESGELYMSEKTKQILDEDVQHILKSCLEKATALLSIHKDCLEDFTQELLDKGDLQYEEILAIFNKHHLIPASSQEQRKKIS